LIQNDFIHEKEAILEKKSRSAVSRWLQDDRYIGALWEEKRKAL